MPRPRLPRRQIFVVAIGVAVLVALPSAAVRIDAAPRTSSLEVSAAALASWERGPGAAWPSVSWPPAGISTPPPTVPIGAVNRTLFLGNDTLLPGNVPLRECLSPAGIVFDPLVGEVVLTCGATHLPDGTSLSAIVAVDPSTGNVTRIIESNALPDQIVFDRFDGQLYFDNLNSTNIGSLNASSLVPGANISLGAVADGIALDPVNQQLYAAEGADDRAVVVNTTTRLVVATVATGSTPLWVTFAPPTGEVFVSNDLGTNLTVINGTTDRVTASIPVGTHPTDMAFDPKTGLVYVANGGSANVTVVNATIHRSVGSIATVSGQGAISYASGTGEIYVSGFTSNQVEVVNTTAGSVVASLSVATAPIGLLEQPDHATVWVACGGGGGIVERVHESSRTLGSPVVLTTFPLSVVNDPRDRTDFVTSTDRPLGISQNVTAVSALTDRIDGSFSFGGFTEGMTWDPTTDLLYVTNAQNDTVSVVGGSDLRLRENIPVGSTPRAALLDPANRWLYVADYGGSNLTVINTSSARSVASIPVGAAPDDLAYDPLHDRIYVANYNSANVSVVDPTAGRAVASVAVGAGPFGIAYDAARGWVAVSDLAVHNVCLINTTSQLLVRVVGVGSQPDGVTYVPADHDLYVSNAGSDNLTVLGGPADLPIGSIVVGSAPGGAAYDPTHDELVVANSFSGSLTFITLPPPPAYPVSFLEHGLPPGTPWSVTVNGRSNGTTTPTIGFEEPNGTGYAFSVPVPSGHAPTPAAGTFNVTGNPVQVTIDFGAAVPTTYLVQFNETGLPYGSSWDVQLNGSVLPSTSGSATAELPNGTAYPYLVDGPTHYAPAPAAGTLNVTGRAVYVSVAFGPASPSPTITALATDPTTLVASRPFNLSVTVGGGEPPLGYEYQGLPTGCVSVNASRLPCVTPSAGTYTVNVTVSDFFHRTASRSLSFVITPASGSGGGGTTGSGLNPLELGILAGVALAAVLGVAAGILRRRPGPPHDDGGPPGG